MEGIDLLDKAMNVGYNMLMGKNEPFKPTFIALSNESIPSILKW